MKLKIRLTKITITFVIATLILGGGIFSLFFKQFIKWPWGWFPYTMIAIWLISSIVFYIISIKSNYYILSKRYVTVVKYRRRLVYNFSEIIYIDEKQSEKSHTICFVTNKGHVRYLTFDKDNVLYRVMLQKCENRLDEQSFKFKYPNIKV